MQLRATVISNLGQIQGIENTSIDAFMSLQFLIYIPIRVQISLKTYLTAYSYFLLTIFTNKAGVR
jgi:hypothetical protein